MTSGAAERRAGPGGTAKDRALRLLGVRWRSREELRTRLRRAGFAQDEVDRALEDLERVGLVDDARFAREAVQGHTNRRLAGDRAVRAALRQKGVEQAIAEEAIMAAGDEADRARELAFRRAARMVSLGPEAAARRLYGVLLRRGYGHAVAREACRAAISDAFGQDLGPDRDS